MVSKADATKAAKERTSDISEMVGKERLMANMSYCRFENTANDLRDCVDNWDTINEQSSTYEIEGQKRILDLAIQLVEELVGEISEY